MLGFKRTLSVLFNSLNPSHSSTALANTLAVLSYLITETAYLPELIINLLYKIYLMVYFK
jgi:hypothetical protein